MRDGNIAPSLGIGVVGAFLTWVGFALYPGIGIAIAVAFGFIIINIIRS